MYNLEHKNHPDYYETYSSIVSELVNLRLMEIKNHRLEKISKIDFELSKYLENSEIKSGINNYRVNCLTLGYSAALVIGPSGMVGVNYSFDDESEKRFTHDEGFVLACQEIGLELGKGVSFMNAVNLSEQGIVAVTITPYFLIMFLPQVIDEIQHEYLIKLYNKYKVDENLMFSVYQNNESYECLDENSYMAILDRSLNAESRVRR